MALIIQPKTKDVDGTSVARIIPNGKLRMIGPFIFIDHMGPAEFAAGEGIDVRPHPHIGLSTLTYLLDGSMLHRDSLGNQQEIRPGDVNWMTAGKGIVHSERESLEVKVQPHSLNGMQCWIALPKALAEIDPGFTHVGRDQLPHYIHDGVLMRLIAGEAFGMTSPIRTYSHMFFLDVVAKKGKTISRPWNNQIANEQQCMLYILTGSISLNGVAHGEKSVLLLEDEQEIHCEENTRLIMLGGEKWDEVPFIDWNFVSFSQERLEQAKQDWKDQRFPKIPGDDMEYTEYPTRTPRKQ